MSVEFNSLRLPHKKKRVLAWTVCGRIVSGLLTGFGLDFVAGKLSGPDADSATLQLVGVLFVSILLPGSVGAQLQPPQKIINAQLLAVTSSPTLKGTHTHTITNDVAVSNS
eukprot:968082-Amphidinium_carterae.1